MEFEFDVVPAEGWSRADVIAILEGDDPGGLSTILPGAHVSTVVELRESIGWVPTVLSVVLSVPAGVASAVIASWLTGTLRGKAKALKVDRTIIELDEGKITRVIEEHIRETEADD